MATPQRLQLHEAAAQSRYRGAPRSQCSMAMRICSLMPGGVTEPLTSAVASLTPRSISLSLSKGVHDASSAVAPFPSCTARQQHHW
jgi:hypothetical protein